MPEHSNVPTAESRLRLSEALRQHVERLVRVLRLRPVEVLQVDLKHSTGLVAQAVGEAVSHVDSLGGVGDAGFAFASGGGSGRDHLHAHV